MLRCVADHIRGSETCKQVCAGSVMQVVYEVWKESDCTLDFVKMFHGLNFSVLKSNDGESQLLNPTWVP